MPKSYKSSGPIRKTGVRAKAARAATSIMRQAGYSARRSAFTANSLVRLGGRMPANSMELKNVDTTTGSIVQLGTPSAAATLLNGLAQGTTATTRLGRRITMKSIYILWEGNMAATSVGASPLRLLIVYDKQANATAPVATDVLQTDAIFDASNLSNSHRFVTLCDEIVESVGTGGPQAWFRKIYKKINLQTEFNTGSAGTIGDIQTGSVYAFCWQSGGIITAVPTSTLKTRIRYSDN